MLATACGSGGDAVEAEPAQEETRSITHEMGVTEVPVDPQRVVVLDTNKILATALLLDVPIVGHSDRPFDEAVLPFLDDESLADAAQVGFNPANIEQAAAAEPDLIIGGTDEEDSYDQLSTIAPTVMFQYPGSAPWKDNLREVAAVFGDTEQTDQGIAEYEARAADIRARLGDRVGTEATLANLRALDDIRTMSGDWCSAAAMEEIGLVRPPAQRSPREIDKPWCLVRRCASTRRAPYGRVAHEDDRCGHLSTSRPVTTCTPRGCRRRRRYSWCPVR